MKTLLLTTVLLLTSQVFAKTTHTCEARDFGVTFSVENGQILPYQIRHWTGEMATVRPKFKGEANGEVTYSLYAGDDGLDTNYGFWISLQNDKITKATLWTSGNDADNYWESPESDTVSCY